MYHMPYRKQGFSVLYSRGLSGKGKEQERWVRPPHCLVQLIPSYRIAWSQVAGYQEYQSVCPLVRLGTPPLPQASVSPPRNQSREHTSLRVRAWGVV
jgi:hypothetical protein